MLQVPIVKERSLATDEDTDECRCPGYFQDKCLENAFQGCFWQDDWCQCGEPGGPVVFPPVRPPVQPPLPPISPPLPPAPEPEEPPPLPPVSPPEPPAPLQNHGANCWGPCQRTAGRCDFCGTEGLCCRQGFGSDPAECGGQGAPNFHTCIIPEDEPEAPEVPALRNQGANCWTPCDRTAGRCDFSGTEGVCCREGFAGDPEECGGRGAPSFHTCILPVETITLQNEGENCWNPCGRTAGPCDYCGTEGVCCRRGFASDPEVCGGRGPPNYHSCILPAELEEEEPEDIPALANHGANCWVPCDRTAGACNFCGKEGVCCRQGFASDPEVCGGLGAANFHTCILPVEQEVQPAPLQNHGANCWGPCDRTAGRCDYCGTEGLCCRQGFGSDPAECGGQGAPNFHTCIIPEVEPEAPEVPALRNQGANCWTPCDRTAGRCDFCGTEGVCCREGFAGDPEECGGRGAPSFHTCILPVDPVEDTTLQNG